MGQIVTLQDGLYKYELPPLPPEREIWYYDAPKSEQYWKTVASKTMKWLNPKGEIWNVKQMREKERVEYITYWRKIWDEGVWIMINGEPTYLTGMHVEHLVFNRFKSGYFYYLDSQRERFYFRDLTNKEVTCDGRCWAKGRRVGITSEEITEAIRCLLSDYSNHVAFQSDTLPKAKSTLMDKTIEAYIRRPIWMREDFYSSNGKTPRTSLELTSITLTDIENEPLGGKARAFPTTAKAIDGEEFMLDVIDEASKIVDVLLRELFEINKKTIINPGKRGKMDVLSTTGDSKEAAKAVKDWHQLIADSNPRNLNSNGKTNSGLWIFFVSYIHSLELLTILPAIKDKFGKINREMAEEYIWNDVKKHQKDSKEYIFALYKQPMELRHTLLTPTGQGYFSKIRTSHRLDILRGLPNDRKPYVRGRLETYDNGDVYFEQDDAGHWLVAVHPYYSVDRGIDTRNRYRRSGGIFLPPVNPEFGIGYDPIRYKKEDTSSNRLSQAAIIVGKKFDYFGAGDANRYAALYLHRPDDPSDANKECMKAAKYWGAPVMHERVIETVKTDFVDGNMLPFLMINPKDGLHGIWIDSQGKIVKNALDWMVTRFSPPKPTEDPDEVTIDQIAEMPFEDCLTDMDGFDLTNTTSSDVMMAMIELEHCYKNMNYTNVTDDSHLKRMKVINEIFAKRN